MQKSFILFFIFCSAKMGDCHNVYICVFLLLFSWMTLSTVKVFFVYSCFRSFSYSRGFSHRISFLTRILFYFYTFLQNYEHSYFLTEISFHHGSYFFSPMHTQSFIKTFIKHETFPTTSIYYNLNTALKDFIKNHSNRNRLIWCTTNLHWIISSKTLQQHNFQ